MNQSNLNETNEVLILMVHIMISVISATKVMNNLPGHASQMKLCGVQEGELD